MRLLLLALLVGGCATTSGPRWEHPVASRLAWQICVEEYLAYLDDRASSIDDVAKASMTKCDALFRQWTSEYMAARGTHPANQQELAKAIRQLEFDEFKAKVLANRAESKSGSRPTAEEHLALADRFFSKSDDPRDRLVEANTRIAAALGSEEGRCRLAWLWTLHGVDGGNREKAEYYLTKARDLLDSEIQKGSSCASETARQILDANK